MFSDTDAKLLQDLSSCAILDIDHLSCFNFLFGPRQANLVLIAYVSSEGSGEPAHPPSLTRTVAARSYKQWVKRNLQTESQILAPLNGWACAVKICHDAMLEDTNSLDGAHIMKHATHFSYMDHIVRKTFYTICKLEKRQISLHILQHLCYSLFINRSILYNSRALQASSVSEQACLSHTWSHNTKGRFSLDVAHIYCPFVICLHTHSPVHIQKN